MVYINLSCDISLQFKMLNFTSVIKNFLVPQMLFCFLNANIQPAKAQYENKIYTGEQKYSQIWNMAKNFGKHHNVNHWVFHYNGAKSSKWSLLYQSISKQKQNNGYFSSRITSTNGFLSTNHNKMSLNLYLHHDMSLLNYLLVQERGIHLRENNRPNR